MQVTTHAQADLGHEPPRPHSQAVDAVASPQDTLLAAPSGSAEEESKAEDEGAPSAGKARRNAEHARVWTDDRREAVESYVTYLQGALRLRDWTITVDWSKPTGKDALATMTPMGDSRHATLCLSPEFTTVAPPLHGQILVHELLHCHLFQMESLALATVSVLAEKQTATVFRGSYTSANELATDALADAFAPLVAPFRLP